MGQRACALLAGQHDEMGLVTVQVGHEDDARLEVLGGGLEDVPGQRHRRFQDVAVAARVAFAEGGQGGPGSRGDGIENTEQRVDNASHMIDLAFDKGIAPGDIHVDLLVFPISVDSQYGRHFLDAVRQIHDKYGPDIHITGGMSNVSFGLPARRLVNDVFVNLAIEAGADGGIIDPVARPIQGVVKLDKQSKGYQLARAMLMGEDMFCEAFITAFRAGELQHD